MYELYVRYVRSIPRHYLVSLFANQPKPTLATTRAAYVKKTARIHTTAKKLILWLFVIRTPREACLHGWRRTVDSVQQAEADVRIYALGSTASKLRLIVSCSPYADDVHGVIV